MVTFTCIFVMITLILTTLATSFLILSLLSTQWEFISYREERVEELASLNNHSFQWLPGQVARIEKKDEETTTSNQSVTLKPSKTIFYLVPAYGGVNKLCTDIQSNAVRIQMKEDGQEFDNCISYLSNEKIMSRDSWLDRMRNLAMSCAIVCLILLGCSGPLGLLGLLKKQISAIMVTGVMYSLAAVFGTFNLVFMRFKRVKPDGFYTSTVLDTGIPEEYMKARIFVVGWPVSIEWAGLCLCVISGLLWLLLAKIFRFLVLSPS